MRPRFSITWVLLFFASLIGIGLLDAIGLSIWIGILELALLLLLTSAASALLARRSSRTRNAV